MERTHAMKVKILALLALLALLMSTLIAPLTWALELDVTTGDSDSTQGDVQDSDCANLDESFAGAAGCDTNDTVTDFTEYTGTMEGPDASGYDPALTENDNARDFIQSIVNFALGFLGFIAVTIVIYGGFLYVTSRGESDQTEKGKKAITYAVVGILIILGSYAFVNTVFQAGGGDASGSDSNGNPNGTTITEAGASFDVDGVLDEIKEITSGYVEAYDQYLTVSREVAYMQALDIPLVMQVTETDKTLDGWLDWVGESFTGTDAEREDIYTLLDESAIDTYLSSLKKGVNNIQTETDSLSDGYEAAQTLYDYLKSGVKSSTNTQKWISGWIPFAEAEDSSATDILSLLEGLQGEVDSCESNSDFNTYQELGLGKTVYDTEVSQIDDQICSLINNIQAAADSDYTEAVDILLARFDDLNALFDTEGQEVGSDLYNIKVALNTAQETLKTAKETVNNKSIQDITYAMNDLYELVKNVQFVKVRLSVDTTEGNAPLLVKFSILGTEDPSGVTVQEDQIQWDFDGDGNFDESDNKENLGADVISTIYQEAGTYRAKVRVLSSDPDVAAGVAIVNIEVAPARSVIILTATTASESPYTIADFSHSPVIDLDAFKVTSSEAITGEGITFDAGDTMDGDGNTTGIEYFEWNFGDNETKSGNRSEAGKVTHYYSEQGSYDVSLTVTDQNGVNDTKYFKVYVATPAARISVSPDSSEAGGTFTLDGSGSSADVGSIKSYQWSLTKDGTAVTLDASTGSLIQTKLDEPGIYDVTLVISDTSGKTDTATSTLVVESQAPVATYEYTIEDAGKPSVVQFDARGSSDPDKGDTLTYEWDFDGYEGEDYEIVDQSDDGAQVNLRYLKTGDYEVVLTVYDQYEGILKRSDTASTTVSIDSTLDATLSLDGQNARHLDSDGTAEVEFTGESEFATAFEIEYGDGETDFSDSLRSGKVIFTHTYKEAGVFYVTLTALDEKDNSNAVKQRVYIGAGDAPISVISVSSDGEDIGSGPTYIGSVKTKFSFSAANSVNVDGSSSNLVYSWNFGDGTTATQSTVTHAFDEKATYTVTLTVKDKNNAAITDQSTVKIAIQGIPPRIRGVSVTPDATELVTPLNVNITVDASDDDGKVTYYKGWYYDLEDTAEAIGTVVSESNKFSLKVNTNGEEGEEKQYGFAVEITDNDNQTVSSFDELSASEIPTLTVNNGPNDNPVAAFTVDKTSVYVGEEVNFSSTAYDTDGKIVSYWWDVEGDGFYNNSPEESGALTYTFAQVHPEGIAVKLKVEDDAGATDESEVVTIYVDSLADAPDAKFLADIEGTQVSFRNNSTLDTENGAELQGIYWDFNLDTDSDGNGVTDDDYDSFEENPVTKYEDFGSYKVRMTVVDTTGQTDSVEQNIEVKETTPPTAAFKTTVEGTIATFKNNSTVDTTHDVEVRSYLWDFNLDADSDGDGDSGNDQDSDVKNPSYDYKDYGSYEVKMTVEDSYGKTDTLTQTVEVANPVQPLSAVFSSVPQANTLKQVVLSKDGQEASFYFGAEGGSEKYSFAIDKNIFYDTDKDGVRDNDEDYTATSAGSWKTAFYKSYGQTVVKLTVTDEETGDKEVATLQVVFEGSSGSANLFNATPTEMLMLLAGALLSAILGVSMFFHYKPLPRH